MAQNSGGSPAAPAILGHYSALILYMLKFYLVRFFNSKMRVKYAAAPTAQIYHKKKTSTKIV
jgi:hypothetical protein